MGLCAHISVNEISFVGSERMKTHICVCMTSVDEHMSLLPSAYKQRRVCTSVCVFVVFIWAEISFPHLEHGHVVLPVDLVGRWVEPVALLHVLVENAAALHVAQTELTEVELREPVTSKQSHISFYSLRSKVHKHISHVNAEKQYEVKMFDTDSPFHDLFNNNTTVKLPC